jgi:hypothetical protein
MNSTTQELLRKATSAYEEIVKPAVLQMRQTINSDAILSNPVKLEASLKQLRVALTTCETAMAKGDVAFGEIFAKGVMSEP